MSEVWLPAVFGSLLVLCVSVNGRGSGQPATSKFATGDTSAPPVNGANAAFAELASHFSAFAVGGGRIYVGTEDGMFYAFGLGIPQP